MFTHDKGCHYWPHFSVNFLTERVFEIKLLKVGTRDHYQDIKYEYPKLIFILFISKLDTRSQKVTS